MDGMEEKIQAFLQDPQAMEKVAHLARSLNIGNQPTAAPDPSDLPGPTADAVPAASMGALSTDGLGGLFGMMQNMDPKMMSKLVGLLGTFNGGNERHEALLLSLKPYLRNDRQGKLDRAAQMLRIARTARVGLKTFFGGEKNA